MKLCFPFGIWSIRYSRLSHLLGPPWLRDDKCPRTCSLTRQPSAHTHIVEGETICWFMSPAVFSHVHQLFATEKNVYLRTT